MKRCLFVTFTPLSPATQGNAKRILQMAELYQQAGYELDLLYHSVEGPTDYPDHIHFKEVQIVQSSIKTGQFEVMHPDAWTDPEVLSTAFSMHVKNKYDLVHVNYVWYSELCNLGIRSVIDMHDSFADRHLEFIKVGMQPEWFSTKPEWQRECLGRASHVLAIQKDEGTRLNLPNVLYLPYRLNVQSNPLYKEWTKTLQVGYVAATNDLNNESIRRLLSIADRFNFELNVYGSICGALQGMKLPLCVKLHGFVENLDGVYANNHVMVNPMIAGTGLKIKTVESIQYGVPILGSSTALQGLSDWPLPSLNNPSDMVDVLNRVDESILNGWRLLMRRYWKRYNAEYVLQEAEFLSLI